MYLKFLVSCLSALSFTVLLGQTSVGTPSVPSQKQAQECNVARQVVGTTSYSTKSSSSKINFSNQLKITTSGSKIVARFIPFNRHKRLIKLDKLAKSLGYKTFNWVNYVVNDPYGCLLYTSPSPRDLSTSRMPSSA